ncbi:RFX DNA-binding domain protein [Dictyocaulus viviparus]|uniref:RFX DNA-binding domain protein n=1 Tax=Dictyocaulus viviparus TaxID=29172 RepID=A0A0D8XZY8_DICVI|nr:RFX DNA-binding domain protein [Dictyocaulus viviparus]
MLSLKATYSLLPVGIVNGWLLFAFSGFGLSGWEPRYSGCWITTRQPTVLRCHDVPSTTTTRSKLFPSLMGSRRLSYCRHCHEHKLDAVNAASFGKLIRSVFNGLRTRRLGTRGNSKYHYYGIRIKADSPLMQNSIPERYSPNEALAPMSRPSLKRPSTAMSLHHTRTASSSPAARQSPNAPPSSAANSHSRSDDVDRLSLGSGEVPFIQTPQTDGLIEALPKLGLELAHVVMFVNAYNQNCSEVLYCVKQLQFEHIEEYWTAFWQPEDDLEDDEYVFVQVTAVLKRRNSTAKYKYYRTYKSLSQTRLSQQQLFSLCTLPQIQHWVISLDLAFYQTLVDILVPDVLMSNMSPFLTQSCRNFAKNAEHYLKKAMQGAPEIIQKKKIQAIKYMAQGLRRYTSLNHLAQAARAVLQKPDQVMAMYNDYIRVDMQQVQEQAGWVSGCDSLMVHHIHNAFKENLQKMAPMEEWAEWLESIVDQILAKYHDKPVHIISEIGKQFLLNWSCYTLSMLIRDLTLRSAGSFGSFHLIRLLTDEYMVYLVESRIAKSINRAMITVISQPTDYPLFDDTLPPLPPMSLNQQYIFSNRNSEHIYDQKFVQHRLVNNRPQIQPLGSGEFISAEKTHNHMLLQATY